MFSSYITTLPVKKMMQRIFFFMKNLLFVAGFAVTLSCRQQHTNDTELPQAGVWVNYKYPMYLRDMRSFRFIQDQIYLTSIEFKKGDSLVWLQYRLREWKAVKPDYLGENKWALCQDTISPCIQLELTQSRKHLLVAQEMFEPIDKGNFESVGFDFLADTYHLDERLVQFHKTGEIIGLDTFVGFKPMIDYSHEPGSGDRIWLKTESGGWQKFGLRISEWDAIDIFTLKGGDLGKKIYHLQRKLKPVNVD